MSKEIQPASHCIFRNSGDYFTGVSSSDFLSVNKEVISQYIPTDFKQVTFLRVFGFSNFENLKALKTVNKLVHLKISQVFKSSLEAGLMFVDLNHSKLITSHMIFRP